VAAALTWLAIEVHVDPDGRHLGRARRAVVALDARRVTAVSAGLLVASMGEDRPVPCPRRSLTRRLRWTGGS